MFKSDRYKVGNKSQRSIIVQAFNEFGNNFKWSNNGTDTLLDVGCGTGDATHDFIATIMPKNYLRIIGVDISPDMIEYAKSNFSDEKLKFYQHNIEGDFDHEIDIVKKFDHITSFFALHWLSNLQKGISNISKLLSDTGDCILVFHPWCRFFRFINEMSNKDKWCDFVTPFKFKWLSDCYDDMLNEFSSYLIGSGFKRVDMRLKKIQLHYDNINDVKNYFEGFNIFCDRIPKELRSDFFNEYLNFIEKENMADPLPNCENYKLYTENYIIWGYASKTE